MSRMSQRYPNWQQLAYHYFSHVENSHVENCFRLEGNRQRKHRFIIKGDTEINVLFMIEVKNMVFLKGNCQELQLSHEFARKILKKHAFNFQLY